MANPRATGDHFGVRRLAILGVLLVPRSVDAGRHVVERGETLEHVARAHGCTVDAVLRANRLHTTLVPAGTVVTIPSCTVRGRARTRERLREHPLEPDDDRARRALEVIDGATLVRASRLAVLETRPVVNRGTSTSIGEPWNGRLRGAEAMPAGEGYRLLRPQRAFGASHVVGHLQRVIADVRAVYSDVHTIAIGDLSAQHGGQLDRHQSHQSGLDVDIGFFFTRVPRGYPDQFVEANADLDLEATWALITAFAGTTDLPTGVQVIFLDHDVQARLYRWAKQNAAAGDQLAAILQYPRGKDALVGLVRHWPSHHDHLHVRFKSSP